MFGGGLRQGCGGEGVPGEAMGVSVGEGALCGICIVSYFKLIKGGGCWVSFCSAVLDTIQLYFF